MTTTDDRPAVTCPSWCAMSSTEFGCHGDHFESKIYLPATGGKPHEVDFEGRAQYPVIGSGLDYSELDGDEAPNVALHVSGPRGDFDLLLKQSEAQALVDQLLGRLALLQAAGE
jgi:hypothetical protein